MLGQLQAAPRRGTTTWETLNIRRKAILGSGLVQVSDCLHYLWQRTLIIMRLIDALTRPSIRHPIDIWVLGERRLVADSDGKRVLQQIPFSSRGILQRRGGYTPQDMKNTASLPASEATATAAGRSERLEVIVSPYMIFWCDHCSIHEKIFQLGYSESISLPHFWKINVKSIRKIWRQPLSQKASTMCYIHRSTITRESLLLGRK